MLLQSFFDFGGFFGFLGGILSGLSAGLWAAIVFVYTTLEAAIMYVWNVLISLLQWLGQAIAKIALAFYHIIVNFFHNIFAALLNAFQKFQKWLAGLLKPVIQFLQKLQQLWNRYVLKWVLLAIKIIQRIRQFLLLLRLFHVAWAIKLDNFLATIEQDIMAVVGTIMATLNAIISTLSVAISPSLVLNPAFYGASGAANYQAQFSNMFMGSNMGLTPTQTSQQAQDSSALSGGTKLNSSQDITAPAYYGTVTEVSSGIDDALSYYGDPSTIAG